jgi:hypothetical protein
VTDDPLASLRQQYHFHSETESGDLDAWDVFRLIELSRDLPVEEIPLETFDEVDKVYWFDADYSRPTIRAVIRHAELIRDADLAYPIIMSSDGRVMDGMHRVAKAVMEGRATISARRFEVDPDPDYRNCHPSDLPYNR